MNHTPLPWTFGKVKEDGAISHYIAGPDGVDIAHFPWSLDTTRPPGITEANVRLFFSAPRLLAELENIANAKPTEWDKDMRDQFQAWAQNRARSLIAEVKGPTT